MSEWELIETAPKDGTYVLLYYPEYHKKVWVGNYYNTEHHEHGKLISKREGWRIGTDLIFRIKESSPTHWMSIPPPPL